MSAITKDQMISAIKEMSLIEMNELVKALEEEFGVSAAMVVSGGAVGAVAEEKSEFDVVIKSGGANKISVIKVVRELTSLGLKEAKDLVDGGGKALEAAKKSLEEAGAVVELS